MQNNNALSDQQQVSQKDNSVHEQAKSEQVSNHQVSERQHLSEQPPEYHSEHKSPKLSKANGKIHKLADVNSEISIPIYKQNISESSNIELPVYNSTKKIISKKTENKKEVVHKEEKEMSAKEEVNKEEKEMSTKEEEKESLMEELNMNESIKEDEN